MPRILGFCLIALTFFAGAARADDVTSFRLSNGMDVVVIEDHRAPVVVHMVWYKVGAADEPPGVSGIAHFTEHLMFKGTDTYPAGAFSQIVEANGGTDNAFTAWDYTAFFQRVAADRLPLMMKMEADRMEGLTLTANDVNRERDVILEERNTRTDNSPDALFGEQRRAAQFLNSPYGIPIIGWRAEMEALTRQEALDFYHTHYAPNNAILVVAGDVQPDAVRALAEKYYGPLKANESLRPRHRPQEPPQLAERRLTMADARVAQPYVVRSYLAPERDPGNQKTAAALTFLAELLGGDGATSLLGQKLQFDSQTALYTSASYNGTSVDDTMFTLVVVPAEGVGLQQAEDAMDKVLAGFIKDGPNPQKFASLKMQMRASQIYDKDSIHGLAQKYGEALAVGLSVGDVQAWPDILQAVTPQDVVDAAKMVFNRKHAVTGWLERDTAPEVTQ